MKTEIYETKYLSVLSTIVDSFLLSVIFANSIRKLQQIYL